MKMLPTPTTQEIEHPNMKLNEDGQKIDEGWQEQSQLKSSGHSENVEDSRRTLQSEDRAPRKE
jgi:hypothetical protein